MVGLAIESLRRTGRLRVRVTGSSMLPAIRPGDILEVRTRAVREMRPGSVALFERDGRLFAHRVVRRDGSVLVTRGDTLSHDDAAAGEILGEVVRIERGGRLAAPRATLLRRGAAFVFRRSPLAGRLFMRLCPP